MQRCWHSPGAGPPVHPRDCCASSSGPDTERTYPERACLLACQSVNKQNQFPFTRGATASWRLVPAMSAGYIVMWVSLVCLVGLSTVTESCMTEALPFGTCNGEHLRCRNYSTDALQTGTCVCRSYMVRWPRQPKQKDAKGNIVKLQQLI